MRSAKALAIPFLAGVLCAACVDAPRVIQGTVVSRDAASRTVVVRDEKPPGAELAISLADAEVGAEPETGDLVRVAYREKGGQAVALRVMNLTRQGEVGKKGSGGH